MVENIKDIQYRIEEADRRVTLKRKDKKMKRNNKNNKS